MNEKQLLAVGLDLGGTNIKAGLVDHKGAIIQRLDRPSDAARGPEAVIKDLITAARTIVESAPDGWNQVAGVGIGSPGPLSPRKGRIAKMANLPGWNDVPLRDRIADALGCDVHLDNDANLAAFGEYWVHRDRHPEDMVLLTLGTGVGVGAIIEGRVLHGHFENAAELGHMIVQVNGLPCPCGQRGCLEQYASASALGRRARQALVDGEASSLRERLDHGQEIAAEHVERAAKDGDGLACRLWDEACLNLAVAVINIQHGYNPARVVLGGGLSRAGDFLVNGVRKHLQDQRWRLFDDVPEIALAKLGYDAGVIGAAALVWKSRESLTKPTIGGKM
ncbi:MAG: ROK family protein [Phycisphaerae bacterium]|nr:ROK family protein [Phycisphaerae bacterium]